VKSTEREQFAKMMIGLGEYYGKSMSPMLIDIYWQGLAAYDYDAVNAAINAHVRNTDTGQFMPKIADVERYMHGNTSTRAMQAWVKVARAVQEVGTYETVAFSDPLIHACIDDMGGWPAIGQILNDELPFKIREFEKRYMAYLQIPPAREPSRMLLGLYERTNKTLGYHGLRPPIMIEDKQKMLSNQSLADD
jgi:hypothetical protein